MSWRVAGRLPSVSLRHTIDGMSKPTPTDGLRGKPKPTSSPACESPAPKPEENDYRVDEGLVESISGQVPGLTREKVIEELQEFGG